MVAMGILVLVTSIAFYRRHKGLRIFTWLLFLDLAEIASEYWHYIRPGERFPHQLAAGTTLFFLLAENVVCILFVYTQLLSRKWKIVVAALPVFFVAMCFLLAIFRPSIRLNSIYALDCITLTVPCLLYFYELFVYPLNKPLMDEPGFWVVTGIMFLNCCSIPLYLADGLSHNDRTKALSLNCLLYAFFYGMLFRAYLCSPVAKRSADNGHATVAMREHGHIKPIN
jgi:hypothetical protein